MNLISEYRAGQFKAPRPATMMMVLAFLLFHILTITHAASAVHDDTHEIDCEVCVLADRKENQGETVADHDDNGSADALESFFALLPLYVLEDGSSNQLRPTDYGTTPIYGEEHRPAFVRGPPTII